MQPLSDRLCLSSVWRKQPDRKREKEEKYADHGLYRLIGMLRKVDSVMKRWTIVLLTVAMTSVLAACGTGKDNGKGNDGDKDAVKETKIESALELWNTVWGSYSEDEKFPAAGGDYAEENANSEGPGRFGLEDAATLESMLAVPEASSSLIDDAASLMHMMNANTFTGGAFHLKKTEDVSAFADAMKESISTRRWMCGFPDKYLIVTVGDYVVSAFGEEGNMNIFKEKLLAAYSTAKVVYEEAIE